MSSIIRELKADLNLMMVTVRMFVRPRVRLMIRASQDDRHQEDYHVMLIARDVNYIVEALLSHVNIITPKSGQFILPHN